MYRHTAVYLALKEKKGTKQTVRRWKTSGYMGIWGLWISAKANYKRKKERHIISPLFCFLSTL
jgi:hypothetical protein